MRIRSLVSAILSAIILSGCSSFRLIGDSDPDIVSQINAYHTTATSFVLSAEKNVNSAEGRFDSETSKHFYAQQGGILANLVVRAEASDRGTKCPTEFAEALLSKTELLATDHPDLKLDLKNSARGGAPAGCTVVVVRHLQQTLRSLEEVHENETYLRPPVSTISLALISDAVRIALRNEKLKQ